MKIEDCVATVKRVLDAPVVGFPEGQPDSAERLIRATTVLLSLEDKELVGVIFAEAQNRMMIASATKRKAWEM